MRDEESSFKLYHRRQVYMKYLLSSLIPRVENRSILLRIKRD